MTICRPRVTRWPNTPPKARNRSSIKTRAETGVAESGPTAAEKPLPRPQRLAATRCKPILTAAELRRHRPKVWPDRRSGLLTPHSLIHQVFHAIPDMTSPSGQPVNAVYGFTRDLFYLLESKQPDFLFCAFDLPGKTFRHELYEQYKAGRPEMHDDLVPQIDFVHRMVEALGIPLLAHEGFEADDIVATVARLTDELGGRCFIVSGDKDCRQLITERVKLYNIRKNEVIDREVLRQEWGVRRTRWSTTRPWSAIRPTTCPACPDRPQGGPRPVGKIRHAGEHSRARGRGQRRGQEGEPEKISRAGPPQPEAGKARRPRATGDFLEIGPAGAAIRPGPAPCSRSSASAALPSGCRRSSARRSAAGGRRGPGRQAGLLDDRHARGAGGPGHRNAAAEADFGRYRDDALMAAVGRDRRHFVFLERASGLLSSPSRAAGLAAARSPNDARRLAAGAGRPGHRQARPEPEIRSHRAPQRRHRTGRNALRHDGRQLPVRRRAAEP